MNNRIIVIGNANHHNTLSIVRCLGEAGINIELMVIGPPNGCATKSKYVTKIWAVTTKEEIVPQLLQTRTEPTSKTIIICCSDESVHQLDLHKDDLQKDFYFFSTEDQGQLTRYLDKQEQLILAKLIGFNVPLSKVYDGKGIFSFDKFPSLLKPLESINGGKKIKICQNSDEMKKEIESFSKGNSVQVQQFINREKEFVVVGLSTAEGIIIPAYVEKIRDNKGGTTFSIVRRIERLPSTDIDKCRQIINRIGYRGLFGIEMIQSNGKYYFIEVNLRNDATCYAISKAGVNLPLAYVKSSIGDDINKLIHHPIEEIYSMVELKDLKFVLKGKVAPHKWISQMRKSQCKYYYNCEDPNPFKFAIREIVLRPFHK